MDMNGVPEHVREVMLRLGESYLVGGSVRDMLLGLTVCDWDVAVGLRPEEVMSRFESVRATGLRYGTVTVETACGDIEVTSFRVDGRYSGGRRPDCVEYTSSLLTDLSRRDFTINAMAVSLSGDLIDPFGGVEDLRCGIIRVVGDPFERFREDALRMFRAFRFASRFGFRIDDLALEAIYECSEFAACLSGERICSEVEKMLLSDNPGVVSEVLRSGLLFEFTGALSGALDFRDLREVDCSALHRWCAFLSRLMFAGAPETISRMFRLDGHSCKLIESAYRASLSLDYRDMVCVKGVCLDYGRTTSELALLSCASYDSEFSYLEAGVIIRDVIRGGEALTLSDLAVGGRDLIELGYDSGVKVGLVLRELALHVHRFPSSNSRDVLLGLAREWLT